MTVDRIKVPYIPIAHKTWREVTAIGRFKAGAAVEVRGISGDFVITSIAIDLQTEEIRWVSVLGGKHGRSKQYRSVTPDRIIVKRTPKEAQS